MEVDGDMEGRRGLSSAEHRGGVFGFNVANFLRS